MKNIIPAFSVFLGIVCCFLLIYLGSHIHPSFDDFAWPVWVRKWGLKETQVFVYNNVNGRALSTLVSTLMMAEPNFFLKYKLFSIVYIIFFIASLYRFSFVVFSNSSQSRLFALAITGMLMYTFLLIIPESSSIFFWLTGAIVYLSIIILFLLLLTEIELFYKNDKQGFHKPFFVMALLCLLMPLFSEMSVFIVLPILAYRILADKVHKSFWNFPFIIVSICMVASMYINYVGSQNRFSKLHEVTHNKDVVMSLKIVLLVVKEFILSIKFVGLILVNIILFLFVYTYKVKKQSIFSMRSPYLLVGIGIGLFLLGLFAAAFILGVTPPKRVWNILLIPMEIFIFSGFIVYNNRLESGHFQKPLSFVFIVLACVSFILPTNLRQMLGDALKKKASNYDEFMSSRYQKTIQSQTDTLIVNEMGETEIPISIMFNTGGGFAESPDDNNWFYNDYYSQYFKIKAVYPNKKNQ